MIRVLPRLRHEIEELRAAFPRLVEKPLPDGSIHLEVPDAPLPTRWSPSHIELLLVVPANYPGNRPAMYTQVDIKLDTTNEAPTASGEQEINGRKWRNYCWSPKAWDLSRETLLRYAKFALSRFEEYR